MAKYTAICGALLIAAMSMAGSWPARAAGETVEIYSAGSLRGIVADLAKEASAFNIEIKATFGGSGSLRERIEKGEAPDLFMSADVGSPQKLESQGRTVVPAIAFARNRMCIISRKSAGVTARDLIDRLLAKDVRVKTSTPIVDPSGDYAWAIFDRIDALRGERLVELDLIGGERLDLDQLTRPVLARDPRDDGVRFRGVASPVHLAARALHRRLELLEQLGQTRERVVLQRRARLAELLPVGQLRHHPPALGADRGGGVAQVVAQLAVAERLTRGGGESAAASVHPGDASYRAPCMTRSSPCGTPRRPPLR